MLAFKIIFYIVVSGHVLLAEEQDITVGDIVMYQLTRESFFSEQDATPSDPVRFSVSRLHHPDPPGWLHFVQRDSHHDGFMYGMPQTVDDSVSLEMIAVNGKSMQTAYNVLNFTVHPSHEDLDNLYIVELWIQNYDVEELLKGKYLTTLARKLRRAWSSTDELPRLVQVMPIPLLTGSVPEPETPGEEIKEGVMVQFGSPDEFSEELKSIREKIQDGRCEELDQEEVEVKTNRRFSPDFVINWCKFKMIEPPMDSPIVQALPLLREDTPWIPRSAGIERQDLLLNFILTVVLPLALGVLLFIILSYIMFGRREGRSKRDRLTSETQMEQFQTIRQATTSLRLMSHHRDGPPGLTPRSGRTPAGTPSPSAVNTLTRNKIDRDAPIGQAPPPYRMPPTYPTEDAPGSMAARRMDASPSGGQADPGTEAAQPVPHRSPPTLKVRK